MRSWETAGRCSHKPRLGGKSGNVLLFDTDCGMTATADDEYMMVKLLGCYHCPWCGGKLNREEVLDALDRLDD